MTEVNHARSIIPQQAGNNITNNKALTFTTKVSEIGLSDLLVVFGRPCRVRRKTLDPSSGRIRFTSLDFFSGREKVCSFRPDADCETRPDSDVIEFMVSNPDFATLRE